VLSIVFLTLILVSTPGVASLCLRNRSSDITKELCSENVALSEFKTYQSPGSSLQGILVGHMKQFDCR
jgi:hypothetical protein